MRWELENLSDHLLIGIRDSGSRSTGKSKCRFPVKVFYMRKLKLSGLSLQSPRWHTPTFFNLHSSGAEALTPLWHHKETLIPRIMPLKHTHKHTLHIRSEGRTFVLPSKSSDGSETRYCFCQSGEFLHDTHGNVYTNNKLILSSPPAESLSYSLCQQKPVYRQRDEEAVRAEPSAPRTLHQNVRSEAKKCFECLWEDFKQARKKFSVPAGDQTADG